MTTKTTSESPRRKANRKLLVWLSEAEKQALEDAACDRRRSQSEIVRERLFGEREAIVRVIGESR